MKMILEELQTLSCFCLRLVCFGVWFGILCLPSVFVGSQVARGLVSKAASGRTLAPFLHPLACAEVRGVHVCVCVR